MAPPPRTPIMVARRRDDSGHGHTDQAAPSARAGGSGSRGRRHKKTPQIRGVCCNASLVAMGGIEKHHESLENKGLTIRKASPIPRTIPRRLYLYLQRQVNKAFVQIHKYPSPPLRYLPFLPLELFSFPTFHFFAGTTGTPVQLTVTPFPRVEQREQKGNKSRFREQSKNPVKSWRHLHQDDASFRVATSQPARREQSLAGSSAARPLWRRFA